MDTLRKATALDELLRVAQSALTVITGSPPSSRPDPGNPARSVELSPVLGEADRRHAAGLMRVNHVGEICAQALYEAQSMATRDDSLRTVFRQAAVEEADHLAWTRRRVEELVADRPELEAPLDAALQAAQTQVAQLKSQLAQAQSAQSAYQQELQQAVARAQQLASEVQAEAAAVQSAAAQAGQYARRRDGGDD